ncbi:MAG: ROK family protein [Ktedonobacteraceae bacterium]|nr:ROK family protein [Chloroflexota bacterium]
MTNIGIDSGATFTRVWDGQQAVHKAQTQRRYNAYLHFLAETLKVYEPIQTLALALPALFEHGRVTVAPNLDEDWVGKDIEAAIRQVLHITGEVLIRQDTEVAGYGIQEHELAGLDPTLLVTLSSGVGGALVTQSSVSSLEVGHMVLNLSGEHRLCECGQYGCVEADLSGTGIYRHLGTRAEYLEDADFWSEYGNELGQFFLVVTALFKLRQIILIGGISQRAPLFLEQTRRHLATTLKYVPMPTIHLSRLGDNAGVYGAYRLAAQRSS